MSDHAALIEEAREMALRRWLTAKMQPDIQATLAILADALEAAEARTAELQAAAWDEGHAAPPDGHHYEDHPRREGVRALVEDPTTNPYRTNTRGQQ